MSDHLKEFPLYKVEFCSYKCYVVFNTRNVDEFEHPTVKFLHVFIVTKSVNKIQYKFVLLHFRDLFKRVCVCS